MKTNLFFCPYDSNLAEEQREDHFLSIYHLSVIYLLPFVYHSAHHICVVVIVQLLSPAL